MLVVCVCVVKMSETRGHLGSLASEINVGGEESLRRRAGTERTPVQRQTMRMYERRQETWRPLNRDRVAAFIRLFLLYLVEWENGVGRPHPETIRSLKKALVRRVIPWIKNHLTWTTMERYWPMTLSQFKELDEYLSEHMPRVHRDDDWGAIAYFFKVVAQERRDEYKRLEEMEREAMESVRRVLDL